MINTGYKVYGNIQGEITENSLLITTGLHGNEISPLFLGNALIQHFNSNDNLFGFDKITILNGVNVTGIIANKRETVDLVKEDLNRSFADDSIVNPERIIQAHKHVNAYCVDIHSSPNCADIFLYNVRKEMPSHFLSCVDNNIPFALWENDKNTLKSYFGNKGVTYEITGMSFAKSWTTRISMDILLNFLRYFKHGSKLNTMALNELCTMRFVNALYSGLITWFAEVGNEVGVGEILGYISDFNNDIIYNIISPYSGRLIECHDRDFVNAGDGLFSIQPTIIT